MGTDCIGKNVGEFGGASFVGMHAVGCANPGGPYGLAPGAIGVHVLDLPRKQITYKTKATLAKAVWTQPVWGSLANEWCLEIDEHDAIGRVGASNVLDYVVHSPKDFVGLDLEALSPTRRDSLRALGGWVVVVRYKNGGIGLGENLVDHEPQVDFDHGHPSVDLGAVECDAVVEK